MAPSSTIEVDRPPRRVLGGPGARLVYWRHSGWGESGVLMVIQVRDRARRGAAEASMSALGRARGRSSSAARVGGGVGWDVGDPDGGRLRG